LEVGWISVATLVSLVELEPAICPVKVVLPRVADVDRLLRAFQIVADEQLPTLIA